MNKRTYSCPGNSRWLSDRSAGGDDDHSLKPESCLDRAEAKETSMTEHSRSLAGFLHNFKRLFEPAPPATVAPAPEADAWQPLIQETKDLGAALQQLQQKTAELRGATSTSQRSIQASPTDVQQALEAVHNQAAAAILALHAQLQTHLTLEELQHGQALMHELDAIVLGASGGDLEQRIRAAAINRLAQEWGPRAGERSGGHQSPRPGVRATGVADPAHADGAGAGVLARPDGTVAPCRCARGASRPARGAGRHGV